MFDGPIARMLKLPIFVPLQLLSVSVSAVENLLLVLWRLVFHPDARNRVPVEIEGGRPEVLGHTMLLSDRHLSWIQRFTTVRGDLAQNRETRRVAIMALHMASLLTHGGHTRLHENAGGEHAMSEYYAIVSDNELIKELMSRSDELMIFPKLVNGNQTTRGVPIPRQVLWARIVAGTLNGLRGRGRWRGPVAIALFQTAQQNVTTLGRSVSRTTMQRHVYSVMRRWLVNWMMFIWWNVEIDDGLVEDPEALFAALANLLVSNTVQNTLSLPHAIGELAISTHRENDVNAMLALVLGDNWELWMQQEAVASGEPIADSMAVTGEWKCAGQQLQVDVSVDPVHYNMCPLEEAIRLDAGDTLGRQVRAVFAKRIVDTLVLRFRLSWIQLPERLIDNEFEQELE